MKPIKNFLHSIKKKTKYRLRRGKNAAIGVAKGNRIDAYWCDMLNFGDLITPLLLRDYGMTPVHTEPGNADVVVTGSILQNIPKGFSGLIAGAGLIRDKEYRLPDATILGVRGKLTAARVGAPDDAVLGDPGLLASEVFSSQHEKKYVLGLVPHYIDKQDERVKVLQRRYEQRIKVIDVQQKPRKVFKDIGACRNIISSSLHGIITADSLHIPNSWMVLSNEVIGKGFKFRDYTSIFPSDQRPIEINGNENLEELISNTVDKKDVESKKEDIKNMIDKVKGSSKLVK